MSALRKTLPTRHAVETFTLVHWNQTFVVTTGFYLDGTLGEVFIDVAKSGADLAHIAHDAAVVISLALQCGVSVETIRHAITRDNNGAASSILGAVVDACAEASP